MPERRDRPGRSSSEPRLNSVSSTLSRRSYALRLPNGGCLDLGRRTIVMGILNVTPDSFADGGAYGDPARAAEAAERLVAEGADIIDIGGESTRPGAAPVSADDELARVLPVLDRIVGRVRVPISVDTYKAEVARQALDHGASLVNDISALGYDHSMAEVLGAADVPVVLMHNRGRSREMYRQAQYRDVSRDVRHELSQAIQRATDAGLSREQLLVDPGLGFAKQAEQSFAALSGLEALRSLDRPILVGPSRKSFLTRALGDRPPAEREWGTAAAVTAAVLGGAHIVRVHGVQAMSDVVKVADKLATPSEGAS